MHPSVITVEWLGRGGGEGELEGREMEGERSGRAVGGGRAWGGIM